MREAIGIKRFQNQTNQQKISDAILITEILLARDSKMMVEISGKDDFKYDTPSGKIVVAVLCGFNPIVNVYTYKSKLPWSKAIGYSDGKAIYVNIRKLPSMSAVDVAANLIHEYSHHCGFGHGNNYKTQDKVLFSVPYYLSENIENWL